MSREARTSHADNTGLFNKLDDLFLCQFFERLYRFIFNLLKEAVIVNHDRLYHIAHRNTSLFDRLNSSRT